METPVVLSWSGGKDSAMALQALREDRRYTVVGLQTTVSEEFDRVVMQGVRRELIEAQAEALALELQVVALPPNPSNEVYAATTADAMAYWRDRGVRHAGYGDLFLEDVREFRVGLLADIGMTGIFPVWAGAGSTQTFMARFLDLGFRAVVVSLDPARLDRCFAGREIDRAFLADLPDGVDVAGENGEFHTFVFDGPDLDGPIPVQQGETVERAGFVYRDLMLVPS